MNELKLKIAGIGISIKWEGSRLIDRSHPHYKDFIWNGKVDVNLRIRCGNLPKFPSGKMLFDGRKEGNWRLYQNNSKYIIETYDTLTHKKNRVCFLDPDFHYGDVYIDPESERSRRPRIKKGPFFSLPWLMQPLLELLLVNLLAKQEGIMVHGLGINDKKTGMAFVGESGAGKSTLAEFWKSEEAVNILSDEHIIIRKEKDQFWLYGTPWPGMAMATSSKKARLEKIFFIEHSLENKILGQVTASALFPLLFLPFWDKIQIGIILRFCEDLLKRIDCKKLGFVRDTTVIDFVREVKKYEEKIYKAEYREGKVKP
jgi:hypothetical protein